MPYYQLSLIVRPLAKVDLVNVLKSCCARMLEDGAVVRKVESLGYRDLPYKMKRTNTPTCITGSYVLFGVYAPVSKMMAMMPFLKQDPNLVHFHYEKIQQEPPIQECTLYEELKPAPYRKSVEELRTTKRMAPISRFIAKIHARSKAKMNPKSYFIAPFRE